MQSGRYKWLVVGMLWFVCLFNYADRQAIYSVFPLLESEMGLSKLQRAIVGSAFMWVYAAMGPVAGLVGDRVRRKTLIVGGLIFWSVITLATGFSTTYWHLVLFRALEGLGEAFYFPASMSLISDYHGRATRSRAMALHQSSVYAGTIAGGTLAGYFGEFHGWRSGFYLFGALGVALGLVLAFTLREPIRGQAEDEENAAPADDAPIGHAPAGGGTLADVGALLRTPMVLLLMAVFAGANFVAMIFLTWLPTYLKESYGMSLSMAGLNGTAWLQMASVLGVLGGGVLADRWARRRRGGRMLTQALGLFIGVPFLFLIGGALTVQTLVVGMVGFGLGKGLYDANIWASLYDVVPPARRATALGIMNSFGWACGGLGPVTIAWASERFGMGPSLGATSVIYLLFGLLLIVGARAIARPYEMEKKTISEI